MSENNSNSAKIEITNDSKQKKKSKGKKVVLWIIGILLALILALTVFLIKNPHWVSHIKAVYLALTQSEEQLQEKIDKANNDRIEAVQREGYVNSPEIEAALAEGKITSQQHTQILLGKLTLEAALSQTQNVPSNEEQQIPVADIEKENEDEQIIVPENKEEERAEETAQPVPEKTEQKDAQPENKPVEVKPDTGSTSTEQKAPVNQEKPAADTKPVQNPENTVSAPPAAANQSQVDEKVAELITKMYVLKANYVSQIEGLVSQMKAEYVKLPPEQGTTSAKQSIASGYMAKINAMEAQCDAQVNAVVSELKTLLKNNGRDTALADAIVSTYNAEKENTKAYYINTYGD